MSGPKYYLGKRFYCDGCGGYFRSGDMVAVWKDHLFHYRLSDPSGGAGDCIAIWRLKHKKRLLQLDIIIDEAAFELRVYGREESQEGGNKPAYI